MKTGIMKFLFLVIVLLTLFFQSCQPFKELPKAISPKTEIIGLYSNDCDSIDNKYSTKKQLWQTVDKKFNAEKAGLEVKILMTKNNKLFVQLIDNDSVISEKIIKGQYKNDECYYKRRFFYVVPILPILWWFGNRQTRIYLNQDYLILEEKYDTGGVAIIMAGGNTTTTNRLYKKVR
ncbi:MAG: hypothetical protein ABI663_18315 [Chryseolinea sp.]